MYGADTDRVRYSSGRSLGFLLTWSVFFFPLSGIARDWKLTPSLSGRQTYTDNIALGRSGDEQDAFVSELNPGFNLNRQGSRSNFDWSYRLQSLFYEGYDRDPQINHQLQMNSKTELIDESVFLDSTSSVGQANTSSTGRYNYDNISDSGNTTQFRTFRMSPYWRPHWGRYLDGEVRVSYGTFSTSGGNSNGISDSNNIEESVQLRNGDAILPFGWRANFYNQDQLRSQSSAANGSGNDVHFQNYNGELSYRLSQEYSIFMQAGNYQNNFQGTTGGSQSNNGSYYTVGAAWTPSPKFSLSAGMGINNQFVALRWAPSQRTTLNVQFRESDVGGAPGYGSAGANSTGGYGSSGVSGQGGFNSPYGQLGGANQGSTWTGFFQHRTRTTTWSANYDVSTTTVQQLLFDQQVFTVRSFDSQGNSTNPVLNPRANDLSTLTDDIITRKRAQISVAKSFSKNNITLSAFQENRSYSSSLNEQDVLGFTASWSWRLTELMSSNLQGTWQQTDDANSGSTSSANKNEYFNVGWILSRQISSNLNGSLELRHFQQDGVQSFGTGSSSGLDSGKSTENRVTASVNVRF